MPKQLIYQKSSFILLETILSVLILSIVVSSFLKLTYTNIPDIRFKQIIKANNDFNEKNYKTNFTKKTKTLSLEINKSLKKNLYVKKIEYKNKNIKLYKYEN